LDEAGDDSLSEGESAVVGGNLPMGENLEPRGLQQASGTPDQISILKDSAA